MQNSLSIGNNSAVLPTSVAIIDHCLLYRFQKYWALTLKTIMTRTPKDLYFWFVYQKIGNLFAIGLSSAHNFHLHDENSENKKRDKTIHYFRVFAESAFWQIYSDFSVHPKIKIPVLRLSILFHVAVSEKQFFNLQTKLQIKFGNLGIKEVVCLLFDIDGYRKIFLIRCNWYFKCAIAIVEQ